jgi:hypothetical protein
MNRTPRTAFILQIHKNPNQVNRFINQLISDDQADVFVHIDKKNADSLTGKIVKSPNVRILQKSVNCEWGDISQIDATLLLLREVLASQNEYDYVCLRSGQDLLVKDGFKGYLLDHKDTIFLNIREMDKQILGFMKISWPRKTRKRYKTRHPIRIYRRLLLYFYKKGINFFPNKNQWPKDFLFYKGSQWFTIPFEVAKYIVEYVDKNLWYYKFFENTLVPDESFFHTLIMNSPYKELVVGDDLLYLRWGETLTERNSPHNLTSKDIKLIEESNRYFARKFDENIDQSIIVYFANKIRFSVDKIVKKEDISHG